MKSRIVPPLAVNVVFQRLNIANPTSKYTMGTVCFLTPLEFKTRFAFSENGEVLY
jgi:hypothetical protein